MVLLKSSGNLRRSLVVRMTTFLLPVLWSNVSYAFSSATHVSLLVTGAVFGGHYILKNNNNTMKWHNKIMVTKNSKTSSLTKYQYRGNELNRVVCKGWSTSHAISPDLTPVLRKTCSQRDTSCPCHNEHGQKRRRHLGASNILCEKW